jgi:predicted phosphodiesterase
LKIAVISDIHGNSYALNAVLEDAKLNKVERLFILGDIVGYYYSPQIVLDLLSEWHYDIIIGNHENILEALLTGRIPHEDIISKYGSKGS